MRTYGTDFERFTVYSVVLACVFCILSKFYDSYVLSKNLKANQFSIDAISRVNKNPREEARKKCLMDEACKKMAEAVYFEARGEGAKGMIAVAQVIKNRVEEKGLTVQEVVDKPYQFSYTHQISKKVFRNKDAYGAALLISKRVLTGKEKDVTLGANHYYAPKKVKRKPRWSEKMEKTVAIGNHIFFRG